MTLANFHQAEQYLFSTYLVRLSAEFEGILKYHLETDYPEINTPKNPKVDWLINEVSRQEGFKIDPNLRANVDKVRKYRNDFVHSGQLPKRVFEFGSALSWFNTFLASLADPLKRLPSKTNS